MKSAAALVLLFVLAWGLLVAQDAEKPEKLAPYYPTPQVVVEKMLKLGELRKGELHYDLGSGDGRVVIMAAQQFGARSMGFEIDPKLIAQSRGELADGGEAARRLRMLRATREGRTWLADGNAYFNRPGPRLVDSAEQLAEVCHPDRVPGSGRLERWP